MTESLLLALVGGALGTAVAAVAVPLLARLVPATLPIAAAPSVDVRVLMFAARLTLVTGIAFGLAPVVRAGGSPDLDGLREGSRSGGGQKERLRSALVVAEIVMSVVLLVSAGLLIRALLTVQSIDPGFKPEGVLTMRTELPMPAYGRVATREAFYSRVLREVGVVADVRFRGLERESEPQVYLSSMQVADGAITFYSPKELAVRTTAPPATLATLVPGVRAIIRQADPKVPITRVQMLSDMVDLETASRSVQVRVLSAFALIAFVLAGIGIHGLLSFSVSQRTQEIGVRMALGAQASDILSMVLRRSVVLAVAGVIPGVALAYAAGRSMEALLAGGKPAGGPAPVTAGGVSVLMTVLGSLAPTLRALRVDPISAIRTE